MVATRSRSDSIVIAAPLSFVGSAQRIWRLTDRRRPLVKAAMTVASLILIVVAWAVVLGWYLIVGFLVIPYRMVRREERRRQRDEMRLLELRRARDANGETALPRR
jgi:hypothetical protein